MKGNHGRLFTEADMRMIVAETLALDAHEPVAIHRRPLIDVANEVVARADAVMVTTDKRGLTFSPDEPLFVLRGSDPVTGPTIAAYTLGLLNMDELSEDDPRVAAAAATREAIEAWQSENPDRVKVPD